MKEKRWKKTVMVEKQKEANHKIKGKLNTAAAYTGVWVW